MGIGGGDGDAGVHVHLYYIFTYFHWCCNCNISFTGFCWSQEIEFGYLNLCRATVLEISICNCKIEKFVF